MKSSRSKGKSRTVLKIIEWLHLWPSLISSVILIFVCITGTIVVFADEVIDYANREVLHVDEVQDQRLPMEKLLANYAKAYPERPIPSYFVTYKDPHRTVKFNLFDPVNGLRLIYMDPYTGEILKDDSTIHFFFVMAHLHDLLLLGTVGEWIVVIATIIFVIGLITGIILWWPRKWNSKGVKKAFTIQWKARFKRLNYDLHNVLGFYALSVTFVLGVTGLLLAFPPLANSTMTLFGGAPEEEWESALPATDSTKTLAPMDPVFERYYQKYPEVDAIQIYTYALEGQGYYVVNAASWVGLKNYIGDPFFINKYTGKEIDVPKEAIRHEEFENAVMMLHMGSWLGLWGKVITFLAGLIATSLPVTGFIYWWGRRNKKPAQRKRQGGAGNKSGSKQASLAEPVTSD